MRTKDLVIIGLFAALTLVLSYVRIPIGQVPVTLQTLAVMLTASLLGSRRGFLAILIYSILWVVLAGGVNHTTGYVVAFPIAAFLIGLVAERSESSLALLLVNVVAGMGIVYLIGVPWLKVVAELDWTTAIAYGVTPFLLGDVVKVLLVVLLVPRLKGVLAHVSE